MANTVLSRQATRVTYIASLLLFASVAARGVSDYAGDPSQRVAIVLLLAYLLLFVTASWLTRRVEWYLALQTALVLALLLLNPRFDYFAVLYVPLSLQAMVYLPPRTGYIWIGIFALAMAGALIYGSGLAYALPFALVYAAAYLFIGSYATATAQAEAARAESQTLLTELQKAHRELQAYADQVEELAAAEERNRLARELHDSVTQTIFSMTLTTEAARILLDRAPDKVAVQLDRLQELAQGALAEMRSLIHQLRPSTAAEAGLIPALRQHAAQRKRQDGLTVELRVERVDSERLSPAQEEALFRIVQEALNNVVKHAQTDRAEVTLRLVPESVTLAIMDAGVGVESAGIDPEEAHFGFTSMRERAELLGGTLVVGSAPEGGTRIYVEIPRVEEA